MRADRPQRREQPRVVCYGAPPCRSACGSWEISRSKAELKYRTPPPQTARALLTGGELSRNTLGVAGKQTSATSSLVVCFPATPRVLRERSPPVKRAWAV
ncbi:unnamed protein product, partial [Ixodes pacificus]